MASRFGDFTDDSDNEDIAIRSLPSIKKAKIVGPEEKSDAVKSLDFAQRVIFSPLIQLRNSSALVNQTVEVMNQTERVRTLIDTYRNKSGGNRYRFNPGHILPQINFPPQVTASFEGEGKFCTPLWFIPPTETHFTEGTPSPQPDISRETSSVLLRKSVCALLRIVGFTDTSQNAMHVLADAVDEYMKEFLQLVRNVQVMERRERDNSLNILTLEKAYYTRSGYSLVSLHNYYKNEIISKNRKRINEFKKSYKQYNRMKSETEQSMQKQMFAQCESSSSDNLDPHAGCSSENIISYIDITLENGYDCDPINFGNVPRDIFQVIEDESTSEDASLGEKPTYLLNLQ